jgi:hypothetical protein
MLTIELAKAAPATLPVGIGALSSVVLAARSASSKRSSELAFTNGIAFGEKLHKLLLPASPGKSSSAPVRF